MKQRKLQTPQRIIRIFCFSFSRSQTSDRSDAHTHRRIWLKMNGWYSATTIDVTQPSTENLIGSIQSVESVRLVDYIASLGDINVKFLEAFCSSPHACTQNDKSSFFGIRSTELFALNNSVLLSFCILQTISSLFFSIRKSVDDINNSFSCFSCFVGAFRYGIAFYVFVDLPSFACLL